nr:MAG TPA: hypothetical protein [Caudoviricetes sp.]
MFLTSFNQNNKAYYYTFKNWPRINAKNGRVSLDTLPPKPIVWYLLTSKNK